MCEVQGGYTCAQALYDRLPPLLYSFSAGHFRSCFPIIPLTPFIFYDPYSNLKFQVFPSTCLFTFCNKIMTGKPAHTPSKERMVPELMFSSECAPIIDLKVKWLLHFAFSYVQPATQHYKLRKARECLCNQSSHHKNDLRPNYQLMT